MSFDYFYGQQSDLFTFYRVPKVLFTNERFWNISADAKMKEQLSEDESELFALADSVLRKVSAMDDAAFEKLNLYPD